MNLKNRRRLDFQVSLIHGSGSQFWLRLQPLPIRAPGLTKKAGTSRLRLRNHIPLSYVRSRIFWAGTKAKIPMFNQPHCMSVGGTLDACDDLQALYSNRDDKVSGGDKQSFSQSQLNFIPFLCLFVLPLGTALSPELNSVVGGHRALLDCFDWPKLVKIIHSSIWITARYPLDEKFSRFVLVLIHFKKPVAV